MSNFDKETDPLDPELVKLSDYGNFEGRLSSGKKINKNKSDSSSGSGGSSNGGESSGGDDPSNENNSSPPNNGKYTADNIYYLQIMYIIAIIIWILIIVFLKLYETDIIGWIILLVPIIIFIIGFTSLSGIDQEVEDFMLQTDFLQLGYIIIVIVLMWDKSIKNSKIFHLIGIGLALLVMSMIDVWISKSKLVYMKHFESIVQTMAAVILIFALYYYYTIRANIAEEEENEEEKPVM